MSHPLDDNLGLLYFLAQRYSHRFPLWEVDEIVSEFYQIARPAYDRRFDPDKGSLSRFLTLIITQDVHYKHRRLHGAIRRRIDGKNRWIQLEQRGFDFDEYE